MTCCDHCRDTANLFDDKTAEKELRKYRTKGPARRSTRLLLDRLKRMDLREKTLLDIGGGIGVIQHELLREGMAAALLVEASPAYLEAAEGESRQRGDADRTSFRYGDFVELASDLPETDLVTLDRVICCYPYMQRLVEASTAKAGRWYGVVYPRERWYNRMLVAVGNTYCWMKGVDFRGYIHSGVDETIRTAGFMPFYQAETILWKVALYERQT